MNEHRDSEIVIHVSRVQQEILLQLMIKKNSFKGIPIGELRDFCTTAIAQIRNYEYYFENNVPKKLFDDEKCNQSTFVTDIIMDSITNKDAKGLRDL
ncbi:MAG: hypothetical protein GY804_00985 [Alphaproteobacteria bacterium]|nr:hypothetical protein [Alphaproteobacteria bacterium]